MPRPLQFVLLSAAVWIVFFIFAAWPTPDSNESAYLPQARHFRDGAYCRGDLFLESPPPHRLFCNVTGWAAQQCSLTTLAWVGRLLTWALLAAAWTTLARSVQLSTAGTVLSAACFVFLNYTCQVAGEWVVGGFEAKGIAWALVWWGVAQWLRNRTATSVACAGLATAWHVLAGGWSLVALAAASFGRKFRGSGRAWFLAVAIAVLGVSTGVRPSIDLDEGVAGPVRSEAMRIYVFEACPFHLLPDQFHPARVAAFLGQLTLWLCLARPERRLNNPQLNSLRRLVGVSLAIAAVGLLIRVATWRDDLLAASLLRFYWFRIADVFLPLGTALSLTTLLGIGSRDVVGRRRIAAIFVVLITGGFLCGLTAYRLVRPAARSEERIASPPDWHQVCRWIRDNTSPGTIVLTPPDTQTFHWWAERAEVATRKDLPHDAAGLLEWKRRFERVRTAYDALARAVTDAELRASTDEFRSLALKYSAEYVIAPAEPKLPLQRIGPAVRHYAVYRIDDVDLSR